MSPKKPDRRVISAKRIAGEVQHWSGTWGWIVPLQEVKHPDRKKTDGKVYVSQADLEGVSSLRVGSTVDFLLYSDSKGLGASCCRVQEDSDDADLPVGWSRVWSEEHSEWYFWNSSAKESSWVRPEGKADAETQAAQVDLPDGWERKFDSEHKEWYYWHAETRSSSWEKPQGWKEEVPKRKAADFAGQRIKGCVQEWQGLSGWITPESLPEDLKPLLQQGKIHVSWRGVRDGVELKAGLGVDFDVFANDSGLSASDVCPVGLQPQKREARDVLGQLEQWAKEDAELGLACDESEAEAPAEAGVPDQETEAPLLPGWEQHWSDEHQCHFYWHKTARQSSWERPAVPIEESEKLWEGESMQVGASRLATPLTPVVATQAITPVTPNSARVQPAAASSEPARGPAVRAWPRPTGTDAQAKRPRR